MHEREIYKTMLAADPRVCRRIWKQVWQTARPMSSICSIRDCQHIRKTKFIIEKKKSSCILVLGVSFLLVENVQIFWGEFWMHVYILDGILTSFQSFQLWIGVPASALPRLITNRLRHRRVNLLIENFIQKI